MTAAIGHLNLRDMNDADVYLNDEIVASLTRLPGDEIRFDYNARSKTPGLSVRDRSVSWSLLINGNYPLSSRRKAFGDQRLPMTCSLPSRTPAGKTRWHCPFTGGLIGWIEATSSKPLHGWGFANARPPG